MEHILILSGEEAYLQNADITVSCVPMDDSRASDYGLVKIDNIGRIIQFSEKPKGPQPESNESWYHPP